VVTLLAAWLANSLWSFSSLPNILDMVDMPNAYITLGVTLFVGVFSNLVMAGEKGYFKSDEYAATQALTN